MAFSFINTENKSLKEYRAVALADQMDRVDDLSNSLKGARVIHVNSTAVGGGVAEILKSLVPMMNGAGTQSEWMVVEGVPEFFDVTKRLHNLLQGAEAHFPASSTTAITTITPRWLRRSPTRASTLMFGYCTTRKRCLWHHCFRPAQRLSWYATSTLRYPTSR